MVDCGCEKFIAEHQFDTHFRNSRVVLPIFFLDERKPGAGLIAHFSADQRGQGLPKVSSEEPWKEGVYFFSCKKTGLIGGNLSAIKLAGLAIGNAAVRVFA